MKRCANCNHEIRRIKGIWKHRAEHPKYDGIGGSGGVTFTTMCLNFTHYNTFMLCRCNAPNPNSNGKVNCK